MDYQKLKSGTDVRGSAMEIPGTPVELTDQAVEDKIGRASCRERVSHQV